MSFNVQQNTKIIQESWERLSHRTPINNIPPLISFSAVFYDTLFEHHPGNQL
jgi:hypothetical protein